MTKNQSDWTVGPQTDSSDLNMKTGRFYGRAIASTLAMVCCALLLQSCQARSGEASDAAAITATPIPGGTLNLAILGYNYTSRTIEQFMVNGAGGDRASVSTPTSGGSGTTCCVPYGTGARDVSVVVRWSASECVYKEHTPKEGDYDEVYHFFKVVSVPVQLTGGTPTNLEVHFYPDGHVEAAATSEMSLPRLKLSDDRRDLAPIPRCKGDEKPVE